MEETQQQTVNHGAALDDLVALVAKAAQSITELRTHNAELAEQARRSQAEAENSASALQAHIQRIAELENLVSLLQPAADRHLRMKAQLEARPESQGGFTANGMTYKTFDEAFDVAYPVTAPDAPAVSTASAAPAAMSEQSAATGSPAQNASPATEA
jgi:molecular chaperone GrpE (heat shock protein)